MTTNTRHKHKKKKNYADCFTNLGKRRAERNLDHENNPRPLKKTLIEMMKTIKIENENNELHQAFNSRYENASNAQSASDKMEFCDYESTLKGTELAEELVGRLEGKRLILVDEKIINKNILEQIDELDPFIKKIVDKQQTKICEALVPYNPVLANIRESLVMRENLKKQFKAKKKSPEDMEQEPDNERNIDSKSSASIKENEMIAESPFTDYNSTQSTLESNSYDQVYYSYGGLEHFSEGNGFENECTGFQAGSCLGSQTSNYVANPLGYNASQVPCQMSQQYYIQYGYS